MQASSTAGTILGASDSLVIGVLADGNSMSFSDKLDSIVAIESWIMADRALRSAKDSAVLLKIIHEAHCRKKYQLWHTWTAC